MYTASEDIEILKNKNPAICHIQSLAHAERVVGFAGDDDVLFGLLVLEAFSFFSGIKKCPRLI